MRLLIDGRGVGTSGIGRYIRALVPRIAADARVARVTVFGPPELEALASSSVRTLRVPGRFYSPRTQAAWMGGRLRREARAHDVLFLPHYDGPAVRAPVASVVTVHDLTQFVLPDLFPAWKRALALRLLLATVGRASGVLTPSSRTRDDLGALLGLAPERVSVVPNGVDDRFFRPGRARASGPPYLLSVGIRKKHKNLGAAIDALAIARRSQPALRLLIVGKAGDGDAALRRRISAAGVEEAVDLVEAMSDAELVDAYSGAVALVLPSRYEGFGLPAAEAMAIGTPVIVSDGGALPEVVGEAGFVVPDADPVEIAECAVRLIDAPETAGRRARIGRERAAAYDWDRTAEGVVAALTGAMRPAGTQAAVAG